MIVVEPRLDIAESQVAGLTTGRDRSAARWRRSVMRGMGRMHVREIDAEPRRVAEARRFVRRVLVAHPQQDDAVMVASEQVTNAIQHGSAGPDRAVRIVAMPLPNGSVYLSVSDTGVPGHAPAIGGPALGATTGRGLSIAAALTTRLRVRSRPGGGHRVAAMFGRHPEDRSEGADPAGCRAEHPWPVAIARTA